MKTDTTQSIEKSVKISQERKEDIPAHYIDDETLINTFLRRQSTIVVGSNADKLVGFARKILRENSESLIQTTGDISANKKDTSSVLTKNSNLLRCIRKSERMIVSTEKHRSLIVHSLVLSMKFFKKIHELTGHGIFLSKRALVFRYGFLLGNTALALLARKSILFSLDFCVFSSEFTRIVSLKAQRALLKRNYYYKARVFSDDMLHTIAQELSKEIEMGRLECKVQLIQDYLKISYRQAHKIYSLLKPEFVA